MANWPATVRLSFKSGRKRFVCSRLPIILVQNEEINLRGQRARRTLSEPQTLKMLPAIKRMRSVYRTRGLLQLVPVICIAVLLLNTFRLYKGAYFWLDDFHNLYWVQQNSFARMIGSLLNPVSAFFRPAGMMCYWLLLRFFDLNPA